MGSFRRRTWSYRLLRARLVRVTVVAIIRSAISCGLPPTRPICVAASPSMPLRIWSSSSLRVTAPIRQSGPASICCACRASSIASLRPTASIPSIWVPSVRRLARFTFSMFPRPVCTSRSSAFRRPTSHESSSGLLNLSISCRLSASILRPFCRRCLPLLPSRLLTSLLMRPLRRSRRVRSPVVGGAPRFWTRSSVLATPSVMHVPPVLSFVRTGLLNSTMRRRMRMRPTWLYWLPAGPRVGLRFAVPPPALLVVFSSVCLLPSLWFCLPHLVRVLPWWLVMLLRCLGNRPEFRPTSLLQGTISASRVAF